jgi:predicted nucleic-acid-binding protein
MKIIDANIILRYLLNDSQELSEKATEILENNSVFVPNEIIAEVVYVLEKVYKVERQEIFLSLKELFDYDNIEVANLKLILSALSLYSERKLDFVDTLLFEYNKIESCKIYTFDKKLNSILINI